MLGLIVEEAVVQDGYMNALTDGYGERMRPTCSSSSASCSPWSSSLVVAAALIESAPT